MSFPVHIGLAPGQEKQTSANDRGRALGTIATTGDGRVYRWALNGGSALAGSVLVASPVQHGASALTGGLELTSAVAAGALKFKIAAAAASGLSTAISRDQYKDGFMTVDTNAGGLSGPYKIKANDAGSSVLAAEFELYPNDAIVAAMTTVTNIGIRVNPYSSVVVAPASAVSTTLGVTPGPVAANYYFWVQTGGWAQVQADAAVAANSTFTLGATAGAIAAQASGAGDVTEPILGWAQTAGAQGNDVPQFVYLTIGW